MPEDGKKWKGGGHIEKGGRWKDWCERESPNNEKSGEKCGRVSTQQRKGEGSLQDSK